MRHLRILVIATVAALTLSSCGGSRGILGESLNDYFPMPDEMKVANQNPAEFIPKYYKALAWCKWGDNRVGPTILGEATTQGLLGMTASGAGAFLGYSWIGADAIIGTKLNAPYGASIGFFGGADTAIRESRASIDDCMKVNDIPVFMTARSSNWKWADLGGNFTPINSVPAKGNSENWRQGITPTPAASAPSAPSFNAPQSDYRQPQSDASPPPPTNQHTSSSFSGSNDEYCNYLKMRGMVCKD